jgi:hypothetical protein
VIDGSDRLMQTKREFFFRCVFTSTRSRRVAHVRAWDSDEALQLFRTELRADGVRARGTFAGVRLSEPSGEAGAPTA